MLLSGGAVMRRREFIKVIAGSAAVWPLAAVAQAERVRKIGVLISTNENDVEGQARAALFRRGLNGLVGQKAVTSKSTIDGLVETLLGQRLKPRNSSVKNLM